MKKALVCLVALVAPLCAQNLFDNSAMDGVGGWKGARKIVPEAGAAKEENKEPDDQEKVNRVLLVSAKKRDIVSFNQEVPTKGVRDLTVRLRYRTKDYLGRGLEIRGVRQGGGFTYHNFTLLEDGQWHHLQWDFTRVDGSRKIDFVFVLLHGDGDVEFDDITVEAK